MIVIEVFYTSNNIKVTINMGCRC